MPARHPIPVSQVEMVEETVCERREVVPITRSHDGGGGCFNYKEPR